MQSSHSDDYAWCHGVSGLDTTRVFGQHLFRDRQRGLVVSPLAVDVLKCSRCILRGPIVGLQADLDIEAVILRCACKAQEFMSFGNKFRGIKQSVSSG